MIHLLAIGVLCACSEAASTPDLDWQQQIERAVPDTARQRLNRQVTEGRRSAIVDAAALVSPAVVSVNVIRRERRVRRPSMFDFFSMPQEYEQFVEGVGSGFIVSADGLIITNQHVTESAAQIVVTTRDGTDYPARLLGEDPLTDIAVLQVDGKGLPTVSVGSSRNLVTGEWVVAFGNPFAYLLGNTEPTVTAGVVSAVGRNLLPSRDQPTMYVDMIQTDAAINPGNSGGPLVNVAGEVVGVNSSIFTQSGGSVGIGFAIPIERAMRVAEELTAYGEVRRAWVGFDVVTSGDVRQWKEIGGLAVGGVAPGSPGDDAGIRAGDVLIASQGRRLRTFLDWEAVKLEVSPGDTLHVRYRRGRSDIDAALLVTDPPTTTAERVSVLDFELISVTPAIQQERGLQRDFGALIYDIGDNASRFTRLRPNDVILQINRRRIDSADDVRDIFSRITRRTGIRLLFEREGQLRATEFYVQ